MLRKVFVEVIARFDIDGKMSPVSLIWEDGREFGIDRVLDVRRAASLKVGGQGTRYTCIVGGKEVYMFFEVDRWFMEGKG